MKKKLFLLFFLGIIFADANEAVKEAPKPPLSFSLPLLNTVKDTAIRFGTGPVDVHVFIDPMCPRSRDFVGLIAENKKMKSLYTYHFYLYELKRFHSKKIIETIYQSKDSKKSLISTMVNKKVLSFRQASKATKEKISKISKIAQQIGVYKRPYLILVKEGKK